MEPRISIITLGVQNIERSYRFYHHGLGFPTTRKPEKGIIFFQTIGVCLALFSYATLAEDVVPDEVPVVPAETTRFSGITLAHNTRTQAEVDEVLALSERSGGKVKKPAQWASWGGYSGYFSDPDGYLWEVAWAEGWNFHNDGSLVIE